MNIPPNSFGQKSIQALIQHHPFHSKQHFLLRAEPRCDADVRIQLI